MVFVAKKHNLLVLSLLVKTNKLYFFATNTMVPESGPSAREDNIY